VLGEPVALGHLAGDRGRSSAATDSDDPTRPIGCRPFGQLDENVSFSSDCA
jgi:hypothetical protein